MSSKTRRALERCFKTIEQNAPRINKKLSKTGARASTVFVYSAAKYYKALNKLAQA